MGWKESLIMGWFRNRFILLFLELIDWLVFDGCGRYLWIVLCGNGLFFVEGNFRKDIDCIIFVLRRK